jgi:hypothetical protein
MNKLRCSRCGWENEAIGLKCEKCNSILQSLSYPSLPEAPSANPNHDKPAETFKHTCAECNYPIFPDTITCPWCAAPAPKQAADPEPPAPAPGGKQQACKMKLIPYAYDKRKSHILSFSGNKVALNRDNVDPGNITISDNAHAVLEYENNKWYIRDTSEHRTTFIRVAEKTELKPGDVIVLGNQRFEFG